jgi:thiol-disulfide isomerase/thioredoxin
MVDGIWRQLYGRSMVRLFDHIWRLRRRSPRRERLRVTLLLAVALSVTLAAGPARSESEPPAFFGRHHQFTLVRPLQEAPSASFRDATGASLDLKAFHGKIVLLNFWATWCAPCVDELPSLDRLQADLGGTDFEVVALSIDSPGANIVAPFYRRLGVAHLAIYLDPKRSTAQAFAGSGLQGLPTSFLINGDGDVVGYLEGGADWSSSDARALIAHYLEHQRRHPEAPP